MSAVTKAIGLAKKLKHRYQDELRARTPVYLSPVRRIEQVATEERVCAISDIVSALVRRRSYKEAFDKEKTKRVLQEMADSR